MKRRHRPLTGRTALITGAGSGIGRAIAIAASQRGVKVALVGRRRDALHQTQTSLSPVQSLIVPADVTLAADRHLIYERLESEWGRLDFLVNNAGIVAAGTLAEMDEQELEVLIAINLTAPIALTRLMLPLLRDGTKPRVVNMGSLVGDIPLPLFTAYSASKFGLRGFSNALRRELSGDGIGVTYVAPRGANTDAIRAVAAVVERLRMPLDNTEAVARQLWDGVARGADAVYPRGAERLFVLAERLMPRLVSCALAAQFERAGLNGRTPTPSIRGTSGTCPDAHRSVT